MIVKAVQLLLGFQFPGIGGTDANVRFNDDRVAHFFDEGPPGFPGGDDMLAGGRDAGFQIQFFHQGLFLDEADPVGADAGYDVKIRTQLCVLLQPVFVHGLNPVDLSVFEREESDSTVYLIIILQTVNPVVFCQGGFQRRLKPVIRRITDSKDVETVFPQTVAELPVSMGKMGRDKNKVHGISSLLNQPF